MEADVDSDVDAYTVQSHGARAIQLHTGGMCHLDAAMTEQGLHELGTEGLDLVFLENVGNLVCPAEFDTGASANAMILSVPEGDDKPLKYPLMFQVCDVVLVNKIDVAPYFDFDLERHGPRERTRNRPGQSHASRTAARPSRSARRPCARGMTDEEVAARNVIPTAAPNGDPHRIIAEEYYSENDTATHWKPASPDDPGAGQPSPPQARRAARGGKRSPTASPSSSALRRQPTTTPTTGASPAS